MTKPADDLLRQMDDIAGLHPVAIWPLAAGWWVLLTFAIAGCALLVWRLCRKSGWRADAEATLRRLEAELSSQNIGSTASALSELLRRIALRTQPRADCAGLTGEGWLRWLAAHDPKKFDWVGQGALLIDAPYAPPGTFTDPAPLRPLLRAAKAWTVGRVA